MVDIKITVKFIVFSICILGERLLWQVDNCTKDPVAGKDDHFDDNDDDNNNTNNDDDDDDGVAESCL